MLTRSRRDQAPLSHRREQKERKFTFILFSALTFQCFTLVLAIQSQLVLPTLVLQPFLVLKIMEYSNLLNDTSQMAAITKVQQLTRLGFVPEEGTARIIHFCQIFTLFFFIMQQEKLSYVLDGIKTMRLISLYIQAILRAKIILQSVMGGY